MSEQKSMQIKTKITKDELYEFMMYHNYVSVRGIISVLFSLICLVGSIFYWQQFSLFEKVIMVFMAAMFTVITPIEYYVRSGRQMKKNFKDEMTYVFDASGITIRIRDDSSMLPWNEVMKVISTKNLVVVYFTPIRAFIIAKKDIGDKFEELKDMMGENTDCYKFKMER